MPHISITAVLTRLFAFVNVSFASSSSSYAAQIATACRQLVGRGCTRVSVASVHVVSEDSAHATRRPAERLARHSGSVCDEVPLDPRQRLPDVGLDMSVAARRLDRRPLRFPTLFTIALAHGKHRAPANLS